MKTWALGAVVISAMALVACGSSSSGGAGGGSTTAVTSTHSSVAVTSTGTSVMDPCKDPGALDDCGMCADQTSCIKCASTVDQAGVTPYNNLLGCLFCTACYTACMSTTTACPMGPPAMKDPNDMGTCPACQQSSVGSTCMTQLSACKGVSQCVDLVNNLPSTCSSLPM